MSIGDCLLPALATGKSLCQASGPSSGPYPHEVAFKKFGFLTSVRSLLNFKEFKVKQDPLCSNTRMEYKNNSVPLKPKTEFRFNGKECKKFIKKNYE